MSPQPDTPLTVEGAVELIFQRLCQDFKERGEHAEMSRYSLGAGIAEETFMEALRQLRGPANDQDLQIEFAAGNPDRIRLGASWRGRCQSAVRRRLT